MGKDWDANKGNRKQWQAWLCQIMIEALRVLKPGGHAYVWALPRTSHWTATALEDAGFEIRDCTVHLFGTGFPKSHNISEAIDAHFKAEREVIGIDPEAKRRNKFTPRFNGTDYSNGQIYQGNTEVPITAPATSEALAHGGEGTALKPASEHWWLCRKPLSEPTIAENVLKWGTGGLNIDATRISINDSLYGGAYSPSPRDDGKSTNEVYGKYNRLPGQYKPSKQGRWPANVIMSHSLLCVDGECSDDCPIKMLGEQSGTSVSSDRPAYHKAHKPNALGAFNNPRVTGGHADEGTAARYFHNFSPDPEPFYYVAKPSRRERNAGCEELPESVRKMGGHDEQDYITRKLGSNIPQQNTHPTVKSIALMSHLIRQITPTGGIVLDCFAGSGSTCVAAIYEGYHFIGIELNDSPEEPYCTIARSRIANAFASVKGASS